MIAERVRRSACTGEPFPGEFRGNYADSLHLREVLGYGRIP